MSLQIRAAVVADAPWLAEVARESFASRLHPYLISAQPGIDRFWEVVLAHPASFPGRVFLVAETAGGERLGFADLQSVAPGRAHLSYICVVEASRGRGVARTLLKEYVDRHPETSDMQLDVFEDNVAARALYERLGFVDEETTTWWAADLTRGGSAPAREARLEGMHASAAWMDTYGFAELSVVLGDTHWRLGRPSATVLRCFDPGLMLRPDVLAFVKGELPALEQLLVVCPGEDRPSSDAGDLRVVNRSIRMSASAIRARWEST